MFVRSRHLSFVTTGLLIWACLMMPLRGVGQDLIAVSSITGSSVFVFRSIARGIKKIAQTIKPTRSKAQRNESASRVKRQYETIARTKPNKDRQKAVDPVKLPSANTLPAGQAAKLFAGVGEYYIEQKDFDAAIDKFRDALSLDANLPAAKLGLSQALALKGSDLAEHDKSTEAKALFIEALTYDATNSAAYFGLGEIYSEQNQVAEAIANYEKSLENDKDLTEIYVPLGILYFQSGQIANADDLLSKALATHPESAETQFFVGLVRSSQNRYEEALAAFNKATTIEPNYAEAYSRAGDALTALKRPQEAVVQYQKATALKDDMVDTWAGLGEALYEAGNYTESIAAYNRAKKLKNDDWEIYAGLGDAQLKAEAFGEAATSYNLAVTFLTREKDPSKDTLADLYSKIGFALGQQCPINQAQFKPCQWPAAIKALEKAVEMSGKPIDYTNLGWAYFNASRSDRDDRNKTEQQAKLALAKAALQKAIDANPPYLDSVLQNYGSVQLDSGDFRGAIDTFNKVIAQHPDWAFAKYALGSAYFMVNDYNNAAAQFQAAIDVDPNYTAAMASLGEVYIRQKKGKDARRVVEMLRPKDPRAAQKLEQEMRLAGIK